MSESTVPENPTLDIPSATRYRIPRALLVVSLGLNAGVVISDMAQGSYRLGALQSIALALVAAAIWLIPMIGRWFDVRIAGTLAQLRISELALTQLETQIAAVRVRVATDVQKPARGRWPDASLN